MAFDDSTVESLWRITGGICESCRKPVVRDNRGREGNGCWEPHHINGNPDNNSLANCEILCWPCHEKTL